MASALRPVQHTSLTGPLEGSRRYTWTDISLGDIRVVRKSYGVTVNDVALAAVSGGFRLLLMSRGEEPDAHTLRSLVPVSTREPGAESIPDNRVSLMLPYLPVDLADPVERLRAVASGYAVCVRGTNPRPVEASRRRRSRPVPAGLVGHPAGHAPAAAAGRHSDHQRSGPAHDVVRPGS